MKKVNLKKMLSALMLTSFVCTLFSCNKEEEKRNEDVIDSNTEKEKTVTDEKDYTIHQFVHEAFGVYYYWNTNVPEKLDYSKYKEPIDVLESFKEETDRFSTVINSYSEWMSEMSGNYTTDGLIYDLSYANSTKFTVVAIVNFVYENSPAALAGMERGDIITQVNGKTLTVNNYSELLAENTCSYTYYKYADYKNQSNPITSEDITKQELQLNPVLMTKVFDKGINKIGYMVYESFTSDTDCLIEAVTKLQANNVTDLVLDLRFNGGGYVTTLDTLASMLVPDGHVGDVFIQEDYNELLNYELAKEAKDENWNKELFVDITPKLNLNTLYVLVSGNSASASEELISGLSPYMDVILIGEQTYGKFTSNVLLNDTYDKGQDADGIPYSEWAAYVSIATCKNSLGEMNFAKGFKVDHAVQDVIDSKLGDEDEPLLSKALELITGQSIAKKAENYENPFGEHIGIGGKPEVLKAAMIKTL